MSPAGPYRDREFLAEFYDITPAYASRRDIGFYVSCSRSLGGPTLELGCGTGRVLIPTAAAGCEITGLDVSEHMLDVCRGSLKREPERVRNRVRLMNKDITDFNLGESYALVTLPFRVFQHLLSVENQLSCLRGVNAHLEVGGLLVMDVFQLDLQYLASAADAAEREDFAALELPDGRFLRRTHRIAAQHRSEQYNDVELIFYVTHPDGHVERLVQAFPFRYFFRYEIEHLLARCGFRITNVYGDFDRSALDDNSPEMIFVAEKTQQTEAETAEGA